MSKRKRERMKQKQRRHQKPEPDKTVAGVSGAARAKQAQAAAGNATARAAGNATARQADDLSEPPKRPGRPPKALHQACAEAAAAIEVTAAEPPTRTRGRARASTAGQQRKAETVAAEAAPPALKRQAAGKRKGASTEPSRFSPEATAEHAPHLRGLSPVWQILYDQVAKAMES